MTPPHDGFETTGTPDPLATGLRSRCFSPTDARGHAAAISMINSRPAYQHCIRRNRYFERATETIWRSCTANVSDGLLAASASALDEPVYRSQRTCKPGRSKAEWRYLRALEPMGSLDRSSEGALTDILASAFLKGFSYSYLHWRIVVANSVKPNRFGWMEWRLRHETRDRASAHLCSMHEKRMTQIDRASFARR